MKKARHENLKSAVSSYLKRRNYTASEISFRRSEFSRGISLKDLIHEEELKTALTQENVICFNNVGPELTALEPQIMRLKSWLGGLPAITAKELGALLPVILAHIYVEAIANGASRVQALKFLKRHYAPSLQPDELLDELIAAGSTGSTADFLSLSSIVRLRSDRAVITASRLSLNVLQKYLSNSGHAHLLRVLNQWVQFVSPSSMVHEELEEASFAPTDVPPPPATTVEETTSTSGANQSEEEQQLEALQAAIRGVNEGPVTPNPLRVFFIMNCDKNPIACASLGNKATSLSAGLETGAVNVWSLTQDCLASGLSMERMLGHTAPIRSLSWLGNQALLSGSIDQEIRLWPTENFRCAAIYRGHLGSVYALTTSPLHTLFASASADLSLKLWTPEYAFPLRTFCAHTQDPVTLDFHPNGHYIASGSRDCTVRLWASSEGRLVRLYSGHRAGVRCVTFSPDGKSLASAGFESVVRVWDLAQGSCRLELPVSSAGATQLAWSKDCSSLAVAAPDGSITQWELNSAEPRRMATFYTGMESVLALTFSGHNLTCAGTAP